MAKGMDRKVMLSYLSGKPMRKEDRDKYRLLERPPPPPPFRPNVRDQNETDSKPRES